MRLATQSSWQRARAIKLHEHFSALAVRVKSNGVRLVSELERIAALLNGATLSYRDGSMKLRCAKSTLITQWYKWQEGGCKADALLLNYVAGCGGHRAVPRALIAEIHRRATLPTGGRDKHKRAPLSQVYQTLCDDFAKRAPLPGINYDDWPQGSEFPWSYETIARKKPARQLRALGNLGGAAHKAMSAYVSMDYSKLRKCELYTLDDVRLDILCTDEQTGKAIEVVCYLLMEVASRFIVAYVLKPAHAIKAEDVDELLAHGLQTKGFGIGCGYKTHILFERGTVACSEASELVLQGVTACEDGSGISVHRTSMNGGVRWVGAPRDKASGNAAGKGVIESFNRRLHYSLLHLPGQRGNNFGNAPANLGYEGADRLTPGSLAAEAQALAQFNIAHGRRLKLSLPLLYFFQLNRAVHEAIEKHNHEPGHNYTGHGEFHEQEVAPGVWVPVEETPELHAAPVDLTPPREVAPVEAASVRSYTLASAPGVPAPQPMSPAQRNAAYWKTWAEVEKANPALSRHTLTHRALGKVKPVKEMTDQEFLKVLRVFSAVARGKENQA